MQFPTLETERLKLIEPKHENLKEMFEIYSDKETMKYWDAFPHEDLERTGKVLEMHQNRFKEGTGVCWSIYSKEAEKLIGIVSYNHYVKDGLSVIGYILNKEYWRKGFMTETLLKIIDFGFNELQVHRIEAHVMPENVASQELLEKIGFKQEGLIRERAKVKNGYGNVYFYGLLPTDDRLKPNQ